MIYVIKKDGTREEFNSQKIVAAVNKSAARILYTFSEKEKEFICRFAEEHAASLGKNEIQIQEIRSEIQGKIKDEQIKDAIRLVGLDPESKKAVGKYSLGMRQRLGLAQALMENPDILLLDEPLSGLDNDGVQEMWKLFLKQKEDGKLIVLASHSKEDIGTLCDEIFRFDKGKMVGHEIKK